MTSIADDVRRGLTASPKALPPYLFYDEAGSLLYERITGSPEYYLTRAEREIFVDRSREIVERVREIAPGPPSVVAGAGSASKTELLLRAIVERHGRCAYFPVDISRTALEDAERRLRKTLPGASVAPLVMTHVESLRIFPEIAAPRLVLFVGSSVGNLSDDEASALFRQIRRASRGDALLLLGTDVRKSPRDLVSAYDDAAGVTAAFNKNVLTRINRELGGHFDLDRFRHVARWNEGLSRVEMHLESIGAQEVAVDGLDLRARFDAGETIHTESSVKYDLPRVERILREGELVLDTTFWDAEKRFALHLARGHGQPGNRQTVKI